MGYMRHHAIVVTGYDKETTGKAHAMASEIFDWVSSISPKATNGYMSFFVPPDGSKEGWDTSSKCDDQRRRFIDWMRDEMFDDGSSMLDWVEVQYGDDCYVTEIVSDSDERNRRSD